MDKLRSIILYTLRSSLQFYNGEKINSFEKDFPDSRHKLSKNLLRQNCYSIEAKPRSLKFNFVTELFAYKSDTNKRYLQTIQSNQIHEPSRSSSLSDLDSDVYLYTNVKHYFFYTKLKI